MTKQDLLRNIAETGYNVGFGAKKHFATYDITDKVPSVIGFISVAIGIFGLVFDWLAAKVPSAALVVLGILGIVITLYDHKKEKYAECGRQLTKLFNDLKRLYFEVKAAEQTQLAALQQELTSIEGEFSKIGMSDQILFSGWIAHYKFFWEQQIDWIEEQKQFSLFRDKIPLSLTLCMLFVTVAVIVVLATRL